MLYSLRCLILRCLMMIPCLGEFTKSLYNCTIQLPPYKPHSFYISGHVVACLYKWRNKYLKNLTESNLTFSCALLHSASPKAHSHFSWPCRNIWTLQVDLTHVHLEFHSTVIAHLLILCSRANGYSQCETKISLIQTISNIFDDLSGP